MAAKDKKVQKSQKQSDTVNPEVVIVEEKKERKPTKANPRSKKYREAKAKVDPTRLYTLDEAIELTKETSFSSFPGSVEMHLTVKKAGLSVNTTLPHSSGKQKKIEVASEETIKKLQSGKIDFDVLLATPAMMPKLVPFAKLLGPKGMMPNPKNGTLIKSESDAKDFSASTVTLKTEKKSPVVHTVIGKVNQDSKQIKENAEAVLKALGVRQVIKAYMTSTMGPSVKVQLS